MIITESHSESNNQQRINNNRTTDCYVVNTTYMPAGPVPLRVESCYVFAAAIYMPAGLV